MSLFKSGNPTLAKAFQNIGTDNAETMTMRGTLNKFGFMLLMLLGSAFYSWREFADGRNVSYSL